MHLIYFTHSILDVRGLSTPFTIAILIGSAYGCLRLAIDLVTFMARKERGEPSP